MYQKNQPRQCQRTPQHNTCHNLNIEFYSFQEILEIFHLDYDASIDDLKDAKKIVLRMHPDKSHLPPEYFLFYKKAFELIVDFFRNYHKTTQEIPTAAAEPMEYKPMASEEDGRVIRKKLDEMKPSDMNEKFNELYEKNMAKTIDASKNAWFMNNDPLYEYDSPSNAKDIAGKIDYIKSKHAAMVQYRGVQDMMSSTHSGGRYFDEVDEDPNEYVSCDPFSKLKYDDLRKVHRDQTVFAVSENDFEKIHKYDSIDQYNRARNQQDLNPMSDIDSNRLLQQREEALKKEMADKMYAAKMKRKEYEQKSQFIKSSFMLLSDK